MSTEGQCLRREAALEGTGAGLTGLGLDRGMGGLEGGGRIGERGGDVPKQNPSVQR